MPAPADMIVAYWPVAALAAVLVLVLLLPVRSLIRRTATPAPVPVAPPPPAPPPTVVQRLAASLEQAARDRAQGAKTPASVVAVPPQPRASAWTARIEASPAPEPEVLVQMAPPIEPANDPFALRGHKAFGRPPGLSAPRPEGRDDLKMIHGIGPRIERGLNALGIFHYDQMAAWDRRTVVWVETWFSLRGCIGRERWVEQARALAPETKLYRSVRG